MFGIHAPSELPAWEIAHTFSDWVSPIWTEHGRQAVLHGRLLMRAYLLEVAASIYQTGAELDGWRDPAGA